MEHKTLDKRRNGLYKINQLIHQENKIKQEQEKYYAKCTEMVHIHYLEQITRLEGNKQKFKKQLDSLRGKLNEFQQKLINANIVCHLFVDSGTDSEVIRLYQSWCDLFHSVEIEVSEDNSLKTADDRIQHYCFKEVENREKVSGRYLILLYYQYNSKNPF